MKSSISLLLILFSFLLYGQEADTLNYTVYKKRLIVTMESGFNNSPLEFNFGKGKVKKIKFTPNPPWILKPSISYYGVTLGLGFKLPASLLSTSKYTKTTYFDVGLNFSIKSRAFISLNFKYYKGFTLLNQGDFDTTGILRSNNGIFENLNTTEVNINMRYFLRKQFNYKAALGILGDYKKSDWSPYIYGYLGGYGVANNQRTIFPLKLQDSINASSNARNISTIELGAIPGMAGVLRKGIFQGNLTVGIGPMFQLKSFKSAKTKRGFLGLNFRTDLQLSAGIQKNNWFVLLNGNFEYRRIKISAITFNQYFYEARLIVGYRFKVKTPKFILKMEAKKAKKRAEKRKKGT